MPTAILMPALSPTMEEGKLAKWHIKEGDEISSGDIIAEIETDKAVMEVEAVEEGRVAKILVPEGSVAIAVNSTLAILLEDGETDDDLARLEGAPLAETSSPPSSEKEPTEPTEPINQPPPKVCAAAALPPRKDAKNGAVQSLSGRLFASPLARRIAQSENIDLSLIKGSGPNGRIVKRDVERALKEGVSGVPAASSTALAAQPSVVSLAAAMSDEQVLALYDQGSYNILPHDGMRRIIAERLTLSKQTIPHFYLTIECVLDALLAARKRMNDAAPKEGPNAYKLSVNDFIIKGFAMALQQVPGSNAIWTNAGVVRFTSSDIGIAVAVEGGLFTPVIRHGELKSLSEISNEVKDLAARARNRRLAPHEYQGGATSISNLGMFGIAKFDAVINPPHSSILAVGQGQKRPIVVEDDVRIVTQMSVTLSCDHRVVDGALGAELLAAFKQFIEDPVIMLV